MAAEFGIQRLLLFAHRVVPMLFAPVADRLHPSALTFGERLHVDCELAFSATGADVREAKASEGFRLLALSWCLSASSCSPQMHRRSRWNPEAPWAISSLSGRNAWLRDQLRFKAIFPPILAHFHGYEGYENSGESRSLCRLGRRQGRYRRRVSPYSLLLCT